MIGKRPHGFAPLLAALALAGAGCEEAITTAVDLGMPDAPPAFVAVPPPAGAEGVNFFGMTGTATDDVLLVGSGGAIVRWDGLALRREESGTKEDLRGVFAVDKDNAWVVGENATLLRYADKRWTPVPVTLPALAGAYLNAVWGDGKQAVAVGIKGAALAWDGVMMHAITVDSPDDLLAIAADKNGLYAVGTLGTIAEYDAMNFALHRRALTGYSKTLSGAIIARNGSWLVGLGGAVYHKGGGDLSDVGGLDLVSGVPSVFLRAVAAPGQGAWVVGFDGLVARILNNKAQVVGDVPDRWYEAVWGAADDDLWIAGNAGTILRTNRAALELPDAGVSDGGGRG